MNKKIAIIGAGISGASLYRILRNQTPFDVTVYEERARPGGLVHCSVEDGNLYHRVGGHVFNSKDAKVNDFFLADL